MRWTPKSSPRTSTNNGDPSSSVNRTTSPTSGLPLPGPGRGTRFRGATRRENAGTGSHPSPESQFEPCDSATIGGAGTARCDGWGGLLGDRGGGLLSDPGDGGGRGSPHPGDPPDTHDSDTAPPP